ncbi:MAG: nucleotide exchange factor GrpE [Acidobacteriaceae bacterium]|nr:nucleotide exchange factor GrpE [Acidobacteriaceae bacterium]
MEPVDSNNGLATEEPQSSAERSIESAEAPQTLASDWPVERERLIRERTEFQDLLQRRQAEFDNYRRRSERERSDIFEFAAMDVVKSLLPIVDDFERALKAEASDKEYARGMELIYQRLVEALRKLGLEPVPSDPPLFNPHIHHAVEMVDTKDHPDQTILEEYQRGYYFKGRLLRPAMVKVAVNQ